MIVFNRKFQLKPITIETFHQLVKDLHQLTSSPINLMTKMSNGILIYDKPIIAYHIEEGWVYEYIYHEEEHQLLITLDKRLEKEPKDLLQVLIEKNIIEDDLNAIRINRFDEFDKIKTLPYVYVDTKQLSIENIQYLSQQLRGIASVYYGNNLSKSFIQMTLEDRVQIKQKSKQTEKDFILVLIQRVSSYVCKRVYNQPYNFKSLQALIYKKMIAEEVQKEQHIADPLIDLKQRKEALILNNKALVEEIDNLQILIDIKTELLNARFAHPIIFKADIKELYEGEQKDMLLAVLQERLETLEAKPIIDETYQQEIKLIQEILSQKENKETGNRARLLELYESIFNENNRKVSKSDYEVLRKNGLSFDNDGGHPKANFFETEGYSLTIGSSPEAYAGKVVFRDIRNFFF